MRETQTSLCSSTQLLAFSLLSVQLISCASTKAVLLLQRIIRGRAFGPHCSPWLGGNMCGFAGFNVSLLLFGWQVSESHVWRERKASVTQSVLTASQLQHWKGQFVGDISMKKVRCKSEWMMVKQDVRPVDICWYQLTFKRLGSQTCRCPWQIAEHPNCKGLDLINELRAAERFAETATRMEEKRQAAGTPGGHREATGRSPAHVWRLQMCHAYRPTTSHLTPFAPWRLLRLLSCIWTSEQRASRLQNVCNEIPPGRGMWVKLQIWVALDRYIDQLRDKAFEGVLESCAQMAQLLSDGVWINLTHLEYHWVFWLRWSLHRPMLPFVPSFYLCHAFE